MTNMIQLSIQNLKSGRTITSMLNTEMKHEGLEVSFLTDYPTKKGRAKQINGNSFRMWVRLLYPPILTRFLS